MTRTEEAPPRRRMTLARREARSGLLLISPTLVIVFVVVLVLQTGGPNDVPLGRYIRQTGLAVPFVVLFFMSIWAFPLITALVAGDIVASESQNGTLKTILTRSRNRGEIYAGKVLASFTYAAVILLAMGVVGTFAARRDGRPFDVLVRDEMG